MKWSFRLRADALRRDKTAYARRRQKYAAQQNRQDDRDTDVCGPPTGVCRHSSPPHLGACSNHARPICLICPIRPITLVLRSVDRVRAGASPARRSSFSSRLRAAARRPTSRSRRCRAAGCPPPAAPDRAICGRTSWRAPPSRRPPRPARTSCRRAGASG